MRSGLSRRICSWLRESRSPLSKSINHERHEGTRRKTLQANCRSAGPRPAPGVEIDCTHDHAEDVCGNETQLFGAESNDAHDHAVDSGQSPTFPTPAPYQNRGGDG